MGSIPVHFAWSRDLYQSAAVTFTVNELASLVHAHHYMYISILYC